MAFSLLNQLRQINRHLVELPCPGCDQDDPHLIWRYDRYFLRVNLSACRHCGLVYLARGMKDDTQARFYGQLYPRLMRQPPATKAMWNYKLIAGYRFSEISAVVGQCQSVMDVGAGLGFFLAACRAHNYDSYIGLEPGGPQYDHAVQVLGLGGHVRPEKLDEETQLPFAPQLVTLFHVLEHIQEPGKALARIAKLMDPKGWLVIEVPDIEADWHELGLLQVHVSHRSYFSQQTLEKLLNANGFYVQHWSREAYGIYEGNLRAYARLGETAKPEVAPLPTPVHDLQAHILKQIRPLSLRNGYPRMAWRLARL
ncbi:class I SAM-dependent methyltransferase [Pseudomonas vanderleydeniana]|uniref:Class I SAM-dependent methyltransferase n=1 Tax=Pseudomonas vanderleydeniana TaxID=2745495 RepID=A0A9E6PHE4_9PSED|nr:class I SAM-dependent methyltransferase [Pseudomonas vanderleydeniana]QXI26275.1 class I SAM-dependent methyltransferase [Pseudomonas vanderleydeniana]